jgi:hypothetical protein
MNLDLFMAKILRLPVAEPDRGFLMKNGPNFRDQVNTDQALLAVG